MEDYLPWLTLLGATAIGPLQQRKLLESYGTPEKILSAPAGELKRLGLSTASITSLKRPDARILDAGMAWLREPGHHFIAVSDQRYPAQLREIADPPSGLFVAGNPEILQSLQIGIVGSRNPTAGGRETARYFAGQLAELDLTITSGLALGIDYCAHLGAVDNGGRTIAVLGNGPDRIYPTRHKKIVESIALNGALVSEFLPGTPPLPAHFPRRNRIISGMCAGVMVVEAARRSGSLITARFAMEQGREVFAVPGSIKNPLSRGCHYLIKQGAKLVETVEDVIEELNIPWDGLEKSCAFFENSGENSGPLAHELDEKFKQLIDNIAFDPVSVDKLIEVTGLTADTVSSMLLILEVQGVVSSSGGLYTRIN